MYFFSTLSPGIQEVIGTFFGTTFLPPKMTNTSCSCKKKCVFRIFEHLFRHVVLGIVVFCRFFAPFCTHFIGCLHRDVEIFARIFFHLVPGYTGGDPDIFLTHFFCTKNDKRPLYLQKKCVRRKFSTLFSTRWYGDCRFLLFFCFSFAHILLVACLGDVDIFTCNFFHLAPR